MREHYKNKNIIVDIEDDDSPETKNKKRYDTIKENFLQTYNLPKEKAKDFISDDRIEQIKNIDFSKANPRNTKFTNELAFLGQGVTEGFLEVFNIEVNSAVDRYMEKNHIIEQKQQNGSTRAFVGTFSDKRLKRKTEYYNDRQDLEKNIERSVANKKREEQVRNETIKKEKNQGLSLHRNEE